MVHLYSIVHDMNTQIRGIVGTHFRLARCRRTVWRGVPFMAGGGTARPCRLDGDMVALRLHVAVKVRSRTRNAFEHRRYNRRERLVNQRRSLRRTGQGPGREPWRGAGQSPAKKNLATFGLKTVEIGLKNVLSTQCIGTMLVGTLCDSY